MGTTTRAALFLLLALTACGGGGPTSGGEVAVGPAGQAAFWIDTQALPAGHVGADYAAALTLTAPPPLAATWTLREGTLPTGIVLAADGTLTGTPTQQGLWVFEVRASAGTQAATRRLAIAVDAFGAFAQEGLTGNRAWTGRPVHVRVAGAQGDVAFHAESTSGGTWMGMDPVGGSATYLPGLVPGADVIEVSDDRGIVSSITLDVRANPIAGRDAQFGDADVWYLDAHRKAGTHDFATDFHFALASMGLRAASSHALMGTAADDLAATWVLVEIHRALNTYYLRRRDGSAGPDGHKVCFAWAPPAGPHTTPLAGGRLDGAPHRFSTMALVCSDGDPLAGRALVDDAANTRHEHNAPGGHEHRLGVFVDAIARSMSYLTTHSALGDAEIHDGDLATLSALLHEEPIPDTSRARAIRAAGHGLAGAIAKVTAHEIAHSLGLGHQPTHVPGGLMNPTIDIHPAAVLRFTAAEHEALRGVLPGPGRAAAQALQALQHGGVCTCGLAH